MIIQRLGVLDLSSSTEWTNPVTANPSMFNLAFSPRYWAKRQRRASFGSTISNFCMLATKGRGTRYGSATAKV